MSPVEATRPAADCTANGPRGDDLAGRQIDPVATPERERLQDRRLTVPIRADIVGSDRCSAEGYTVHGHAPILALCRRLIEKSLDPRRALEGYRGKTLCIKVRSLREGAALIVKTSGNGTPVFAPLDGAAAPPSPLGPVDRGISTPEAVAPEAGATSQHGYCLP